MIDFVFDFINLSQIVSEPTRAHGTTESLLDLFLAANSLSKTCTCEVIESISDHKAVLFSVPSAKSKRNINEVISVPDFNSADDLGVTDELAFHLDDFSNLGLDNACDVNMLWSRFKEIISYCVTRIVPYKKKTVYKQNPWINRCIIPLK